MKKFYLTIATITVGVMMLFAAAACNNPAQAPDRPETHLSERAEEIREDHSGERAEEECPGENCPEGERPGENCPEEECPGKNCPGKRCPGREFPKNEGTGERRNARTFPRFPRKGKRPAPPAPVEPAPSTQSGN